MSNSTVNATDSILYSEVGPGVQIFIIFMVNAFAVFPVALSLHYGLFEVKIFGHERLGVRSELFFAAVWLLVPAVALPVGGGFAGYNAFAPLKYYTVMATVVLLITHKYIAGFPHKTKLSSWGFSVALYLTFIMNIFEAAFWELLVIGREPHNLMNGINGLVLALIPAVYVYKYGVGVKERGKKRMLRCNLPAAFVLAYTFWNAEYQCVFHPEKAAFFIANLLLPLFCSVVVHYDWREIRAISLFIGITYVLFPYGGEIIAKLTFGLGQQTFMSIPWRITISAIGIVFTIITLVDVYRIIRMNQKPLAFLLNKKCFDIAECHPTEALKGMIDAAKDKAEEGREIAQKIDETIAGIGSNVTRKKRVWQVKQRPQKDQKDDIYVGLDNMKS